MKKRNDTLNKEMRKCIIRRKMFAIYAKKDLLLMMAKKILESKRPLPLYWKIQISAYDICNLRYKIPKEILVVFHNGST